MIDDTEFVRYRLQALAVTAREEVANGQRPIQMYSVYYFLRELFTGTCPGGTFADIVLTPNGDIRARWVTDTQTIDVEYGPGTDRHVVTKGKRTQGPLGE